MPVDGRLAGVVGYRVKTTCHPREARRVSYRSVWAPPEGPDLEINLAGIAYRAALKVLGEREDALDVAQDTMVVYRVAVDCVDKPEAWVLSVARNRAVNVLRKRRHGERAAARLACQVSSYSDPDDDVALDAMVIEVLFEGLSPQEHEVAHLRFVDDLCLEQIAARLGISVNSVKTYLRRAVNKIRRALGDSREEEGL